MRSDEIVDLSTRQFVLLISVMLILTLVLGFGAGFVTAQHTGDCRDSVRLSQSIARVP